jgi:cytochrome c peroxidase
MRLAPESNWGCNAGLDVARKFLEPIKAKHPHLSHADLWTLAGATAVEAMGGPAVPWRGGRTDCMKPTTVPDGRLPNADSGSRPNDVKHIRDIFGRMGFTDRETVALIGAHSVGRCHTNASGYWGPWNFSEIMFSNQYFVLLLSEKWTLKTIHNGKVFYYLYMLMCFKRLIARS